MFRVLEPQERYRDTGPVAAVVVAGADPRVMVGFWGEAIDRTVHELTDDRALLRSARGDGPCLEFRRTPDDEVGNRVHLDLMSDPVEDRATEIARLEGLGATRTDVGQGDVSWIVLTDPEGIEFGVLGRG